MRRILDLTLILEGGGWREGEEEEGGGRKGGRGRWEGRGGEGEMEGGRGVIREVRKGGGDFVALILTASKL